LTKPFYFDGEFWTVDTYFLRILLKCYSEIHLYYEFQQINWKLNNEASEYLSRNQQLKKLKFDFPSVHEQQKYRHFYRASMERENVDGDSKKQYLKVQQQLFV
jgi:type I restriction enzyme S subunit